jgi:hypothetical protein
MEWANNPVHGGVRYDGEKFFIMLYNYGDWLRVWVEKSTHIFFEKKFQKPIDKSVFMWYNIIVRGKDEARHSRRNDLWKQ